MQLPSVDVAIICAAQRDDPVAWDALLRAWAPVVLRWCSFLGGPTVDPEDAAHDVLEVVLTRLPKLRDPARFSSWLYGVTRRVLSSHRRRAWIRRWVPGVTVERVDPRGGPEQRYEASETARRVEQALGRLTVEHREVLVLCDLEEYSQGEVAALLQIPLPTVKSRLRRARLRFGQAAQRLGLDDVDARPISAHGGLW